jgi:mannosyltransferase OCH1-like enzyme
MLQHNKNKYKRPILQNDKNKKNINNEEVSKNLEIQFFNRPYVFLKATYNCIMPCDIYQTWYTKDLPQKMRERVELLKSQNPKFNHYLFDDNDCRNFIQEHFAQDVLDAYNCLVPGAFKADLWRYCVLFIKGGIYMDIKLTCVNGFKLIELTETNHFVLDRPQNSIYNALMASQKGNIFLYKAIRQIVDNVKNRYYGKGCLSVTGPELLGDVAIKNRFSVNIDLKHYKHGGYIIYKNRFVVSTEYPEYDGERRSTYNNINVKRYDQLWEERAIYA